MASPRLPPDARQSLRQVGVGRGVGRVLRDQAVFIDRDGVIVELVWDHIDAAFEAPNAAGDVALVAGAADAILSLTALGYRTVVVSNQGAAAKGKASLAD